MALTAHPALAQQEAQNERACVGINELSLTIPTGSPDVFDIEVWTLDDYLLGEPFASAFYTYTTEPHAVGGMCAWLAETNWAPVPPDPLPTTGKTAVLPPNTPYVVDIQHTMSSARTTFTYFLANTTLTDPRVPPFDPALHGFYAPYGDDAPGQQHQDVDLRWDGTKIHIKPFNLQTSQDVGELLAGHFGTDEHEWVLPYDYDAACEALAADADPNNDCEAGEKGSDFFITPQVGYDYTFAPVDVDLRAAWDWTWTSAAVETVRFQPGTKLVAEGDLTAEGVTFTEVTAGQGWGGVAVYSGGSLDFDGVTVSDAEVGVDVYSTGNAFTNSFFTGNGVGIRSAYEQSYCDGLGACLIGDRSSFTLDQSCVTGSEFNLGTSEGYGIWARATDALITATTVEGNDAYGLRLDNADVAARRLLLTGNGAGSMFSADGARALSNGDLTLASYFEGFPDRGGVVLGLNSIRDNEDHEISLAGDGYATVGLVCSLTFCPDANRVSEAGFPGDFGLLINNVTKEIVKAHRTYWATTPADPPDAAFLQPALVEDFQALTSDPAASAGRTGGCVAPSRPGDTAATTRAVLGEEAARGDGLDAETAAWLRAQMHQMRQALAEAPGADGAAERLRTLYALQRLDHADVLGEHAQTMALLQSLYAPLAGQGSVEPALRATAEAALTASLHDALRHGTYTEARTLLADLGEQVEGADARQTLALVAVALDEQAGDIEGALVRVYTLLAGLDPEAQLARDLEATAALLEGRLGAQGRVAPARFASEEGHDAAIPANASEDVLLPAYPNPVMGQALVPVVLAEAAEVHVAVYDVLGREVEVLHEGVLDAGAHRLRFDGTGLPAGVYLVRAAVTADGAARTFTERLMLVR